MSFFFLSFSPTFIIIIFVFSNILFFHIFVKVTQFKSTRLGEAWNNVQMKSLLSNGFPLSSRYCFKLIELRLFQILKIYFERGPRGCLGLWENLGASGGAISVFCCILHTKFFKIYKITSNYEGVQLGLFHGL